jgi:hypothetical protein
MVDSPPSITDRLRWIAARVPGGAAAGRWLHTLADPNLRAIEQSRRRNGEALFQPFPDTWDERYPTLFDTLADRLALAQPRILSFGCSTGAEVRALRRRLPNARIVGIDANARVIAAARRQGSDPLTELRVASRIAPGEQYDAILALAVFRHGALRSGRPASCAAILPFERFERGVAMLDASLTPGGWLAIGNSNFRFGDTVLAQHYAADPLCLARTPGDPLYGPDDRRIEDADALPVLFRKL